MIELAFFLLDPVIAAMEPDRSPIVVSSGRNAQKVCDDGTSVHRPDGTPNWDCQLRGCSPHEKTCWSDRLDFCRDSSGADRGICVYERSATTCKSRWSCFDLWAYCNGVYQCHDDSYFGCTDGSCTPKPTAQRASVAEDEGMYECSAEELSASSVEVDPKVSEEVAERKNAQARGRLPVAAAAGMKGDHGDV